MKSRFLNVSPRAYLRQKDSVNVLPPIIRTGYQNSTGKTLSPFRDSKTIFFKEFQSLNAPYMVPLSRASSSGFLTGSLLLTASLNPGNAYLESSISDPEIFPFKEGSNPSAYNLTVESSGFSQVEYPGFSAPEYDKTALVFDISTNSDFDIIKVNKGDTTSVSSGPFYDQAGSGFLYYNHKNREWEDIGLRDPATGAVIDYDPILKLSHQGIYDVNPVHRIVGGTDEILCQFASSPYSIVSERAQYLPKSLDALKARGYDKIGEPTSFFGAPYSPKYHATTGSSLRLSDYISTPFVVDRISVKIPIRAIRTQSPPKIAWGGSAADAGFGRDIDNYVFFVYVQNRSNTIRDSKQDVSSSVRYLIARESICVYNKNTLDIVSPDQAPIHSFAKSIQFTMPDDIAKITGAPVSITSSMDAYITFKPKTFNSFFGTTSKMAGVDSAPPPGDTPRSGSVFIQNFWRGGQIGSGSAGAINLFTRGTLFARNLNEMSGARSPDIQNLFCQESQRALITSFWNGSTDTIVSGSGLGELTEEFSTCTRDFDTSTDTPVVLFPEDELIFGIDAGTNPNLVSPGRLSDGIDIGVLDITGSRLVIRSGDAQVVLYGSTIKEKIQSLPSLNQHLGSDAVHESIQEQGPYDQFDIYDRKILSSSYVDNIFSGIMSVGSSPLWLNGRRVAGRGSQFQLGLTGSLQRNVRLQDASRLYYDTFVPSLSVVSRSLAGSSLGASTTSGQEILNLRQIGTNGYAVDNIRNGNLILNRPFTYENESNESRSRNIGVNFIDGSGNQTLVTGDTARFSLYYNGYISTVSQPATLRKQYTSGSASVRYGMLSPRLVGPSYVYRRDKFGNFRDLLEQSRDSRFVDSVDSKDVIGLPVVQAAFVEQFSNNVVSPDLTQCSNLSQFCTSSVPFIDDSQVHNRGSLPSTTVKFGANNLIFGITGSFGLQ